MTRSSRAIPTLAAALVVLVVLFLLRPIFHGFAISLFRNPIVWLPPLIIVGLGLLALRPPRPPRPTAREPQPAGRNSDPRDDPIPLRARRPAPPDVLGPLRSRGRQTPLVVIGALAGFAFLLGSLLNAPLTARSIYTNTTYEAIPSLPPGGIPRIVPRDVAVQLASSGFNSPTEQLTDFHIIRTNDGLRWSALRTPNGLVRTFTQQTQGLVTLDAAETERRVQQTDASFEAAPGMQITDNLRWRLLKERFFVEPAEPIAIRDAQGRPAILVPYLSYRGLLVRRPVLGGAFVAHPDGRIEDLSPEEAQRRPEIAGSGRLFPDTLARTIQDAYAYKNGIWNRLFVHEEQTQITDTELNQQPYLIDFGPGRGAKWVTVAEPYGRAFAVNAIFLTDTATGRTQIWSVPRQQSLSGNRRVVQTVRSATIPGVVFASDEVGGAGGGRFRVVEPRPVFVDGRLVFLLSIVPESASSVSKSVIVDAARNNVVAVFNNDTEPDADRAVLRYLQAGELPASAREALAGGGSAPAAEEPAGGQPPPRLSPPRNDRELRERLDRLAQQQRRLLEETEALQEALREP